MAAPTNLTATQNRDSSPQIDFAWDGGSRYRSRVTGGSWNNWISNSSGSISIVTLWGGVIDFEVDDGDGTTAISITVKVPPVAPTGLKLDKVTLEGGGSAFASLTWDDPNDNDITSWDVIIEINGEETITNTTTRQHLIYETSNDLTVKVRGVTAVGKGETATLKSQPENLEARQTGAGSDHVILSWDESGDKTLTYQIEDVDDEWDDITLDSNEYTEHENNQYTIQAAMASSITKKIRAVSDFTGTTSSRSVTFTTAPAAPTNLTAIGGPKKITLNWDDPDNSNITRYQVHIGTGRWLNIPNSDDETTSFEFTPSYDKEYTLKVRAVSAVSYTHLTLPTKRIV